MNNLMKNLPLIYVVCTIIICVIVAYDYFIEKPLEFAGLILFEYLLIDKAINVWKNRRR